MRDTISIEQSIYELKLSDVYLQFPAEVIPRLMASHNAEVFERQEIPDSILSICLHDAKFLQF